MAYNDDPICIQYGTLFQAVISDMKNSAIVVEDLIGKGWAFQKAMKGAHASLGVFGEALQRVADNVTNSHGTIKEIGSALTRICVRQRSLDQGLKQFVVALGELFVNPLADRLEEWKKTVQHLEKEHTKETKKLASDIRKKHIEVNRLRKKIKKGGKGDLLTQLNSMCADVKDKENTLESIEKNHLRNLLVEERTRACFYSKNLTRILKLQVNIGDEAAKIDNLSDDLTDLCRNPKQLPSKVDDIIHDFINSNSKNNPTQQSHQHQDAASMCGTIRRHNSHNFGAARPPLSPAALDQKCTDSLSRNPSYSSHHQQQQPTSPLLETLTTNIDEQSVMRGADHISQSRPQSWKDWSKPGPYEMMASQQHQYATLNNRHTMQPPPVISPKPVMVDEAFQFPSTHHNHDKPTSVPTGNGGSCNSVYSADSEATEGTLVAEEMKEAFQDMINSPLPPPPPELQVPPLPPKPSSPSSASSDISASQPRPTAPPTPSPHFSSATLGRKGIGSHYSSSSGYSSQNTTPACSQDTIASHETDDSNMMPSSSPHHYHHASDDVSGFSTMPRIRGYPHHHHHHHHPSPPSSSSSSGHTVVQGNTATMSRRTISTSSSHSSALNTHQQYNSSPTAANYSNQTATIRRKPTGKYGSVRRVGGSSLKAVVTPTVPTTNHQQPHNPFAHVFQQQQQHYNTNNNNCAEQPLSNMTHEFKQSVRLPSTSSTDVMTSLPPSPPNHNQ